MDAFCKTLEVHEDDICKHQYRLLHWDPSAPALVYGRALNVLEMSIQIQHK